MLEIILLIFLVGKIGKIVEAKGYRSGKYKFMLVAAWFSGEIAGAIIGGFLIAIFETSQCLAYLFALAGAAAGGGISFAIANGLPENPNRPPVWPTPTARLTAIDSLPTDVADILHQAHTYARSDALEQAAGLFEQVILQQPSLGVEIAGTFSEDDAPPWNTATGYALLALKAGKDRKDLAVRYFTRILDLNPGQVAVALRAAHLAGIDKEAQLIARARGLPWQWWLA